jgi:hypothetical protein
MRIRNAAIAALLVCVFGASSATAADPAGILQTAFNHYDRGEPTLAIAAASRALRTTDDPRLQNLAYRLRAVIYREQGDTISAETNESLARRAAQQAAPYGRDDSYGNSTYGTAYSDEADAYYTGDAYENDDEYEYEGYTVVPPTITIDLGQPYYSVYRLRQSTTIRFHIIELP